MRTIYVTVIVWEGLPTDADVYTDRPSADAFVKERTELTPEEQLLIDGSGFEGSDVFECKLPDLIVEARRS